MVSDVFLVIACIHSNQALNHHCIFSNVMFWLRRLFTNRRMGNFAKYIACFTHNAALCLIVHIFPFTSYNKNLVTNYKILYENQFTENSALVEEAKQSYLLVSEAEESKEFETLRLRAAAFSVYSQLKELRKYFPAKISKAVTQQSMSCTVVDLWRLEKIYYCLRRQETTLAIYARNNVKPSHINY